MMTFAISDFTVVLDGDQIINIKGPGNMNIPPDMMNSRYQEFLVVDTEAHLCKRVTIPAPVASTAPTQEQRIAAMEDALIAMTGV